MNYVEVLAWILIITAYYTFLKTGIEVFTYKHINRLLLFAAASINTIISLKVSMILGFLFLIGILLILKLRPSELITVALTAEMGFLVGLIVVMFVFTTVGTMYHIKGFEFNMTLKEILKQARGGR
ncbi:hypothetical protein [Thermococcus sp.]